MWTQVLLKMATHFEISFSRVDWSLSSPAQALLQIAKILINHIISTGYSSVSLKRAECVTGLIHLAKSAEKRKYMFSVLALLSMLKYNKK